MFKKLRNKFILTIVGITTIILIISFSLIYLAAKNSTMARGPIPKDAPEYTKEVRIIVEEHVHTDRESFLNSLALELFSTGIVFEIIITVVAYILSEEFIKPVKSAYESQKIFVANASHEIKTPLAAIQANLEAADIKGNHWLENVEYETKKLSKINSELLTLAKNDLEATPKKLENISLEKIIDELTEKSKSRLKNKDLKITGKSKVLKISVSDFSQLFDILLDNAIKYSNKKITINIKNDSFEIKNDGKTLKRTDLEHIFERFYQADKNSDGVGLGLSIAKSIADKNHWEIVPSSGKSETTFKVMF